MTSVKLVRAEQTSLIQDLQNSINTGKPVANLEIRVGKIQELLKSISSIPITNRQLDELTNNINTIIDLNDQINDQKQFYAGKNRKI